MNREIMIYALGNLVQANDLSPQCKTVRTILLADGDDVNGVGVIVIAEFQASVK